MAPSQRKPLSTQESHPVPKSLRLTTPPFLTQSTPNQNALLKLRTVLCKTQAEFDAIPAPNTRGSPSLSSLCNAIYIPLNLAIKFLDSMTLSAFKIFKLFASDYTETVFLSYQIDHQASSRRAIANRINFARVKHP